MLPTFPVHIYFTMYAKMIQYLICAKPIFHKGVEFSVYFFYPLDYLEIVILYIP